MRGARVLDVISRLRASLDAIAAALSQADAARLIAAESELAQALAEAGATRTIDTADRHALKAELIRARAALQRCRALGAATTDVAGATLAAHGRLDIYGPSGAITASPLPGGRGLNTRI